MEPTSHLDTMTCEGKQYRFANIIALGEDSILKLPYSLRVLLESLLRRKDGRIITEASIQNLLDRAHMEIPFYPARVLMQDFTGVPAIVDLAALRDAVAEAGLDPQVIRTQVPVDLVVDHSVQIDFAGRPDALELNVAKEYERNAERYGLIKWAQNTFPEFRVVPPNSGICHQVNLEHLAQVVREKDGLLYPDSVVGTDSHTPMINGLGVLGWGVGGIEAEAVMLGQPYFMPVPRVVGVRLIGSLAHGCTATDLVLTLTQLLRKTGVVGAFVEYFGEGLPSLSLPDRATIANMSPEYGATMGFFPIDERTVEYLRLTGREVEAERTLAYAKANALFHNPSIQADYDQVIEFDLASVVPSIAGPSRPQDLIPLSRAKEAVYRAFTSSTSTNSSTSAKQGVTVDIDGHPATLHDSTLAIAAITSCTNTSNPAVMLAAALLARNAVDKGQKVPSWVKTSLAPGSQVVMEYLEKSQLMHYFERLGFHLAAYGCTTCIGNSGPLHPAIELAQEQSGLVLAAALSGNRNFEGRIHPRVKAAFLMSPPLVVAYALAGRMDIDLTTASLGDDTAGNPVYLSQIWPSNEEVERLITQYVTPTAFNHRYQDIFLGDKRWRDLECPTGQTFAWQPHSTYIAKPPFFINFPLETPPVASLNHARALLVMGDSVTTDHISPAGSINAQYPAGRYLTSLGVAPADFNSYGSRRGNHEVMMRGTFANTRIRQQICAPKEGGFTLKLPEGELMYVYDAAMQYEKEHTALVILAGKEYGTGSSRDWAAKGTSLLGVRVVIAQSFERIHRSNLVGMGVLPLVFCEGQSAQSLGLTGREQFNLVIPEDLKPLQELQVQAIPPQGTDIHFTVVCRLDSDIEVDYLKHGGILAFALRNLLAANPH